jgi:hypothetical protein
MKGHSTEFLCFGHIDARIQAVAWIIHAVLRDGKPHKSEEVIDHVQRAFRVPSKLVSKDNILVGGIDIYDAYACLNNRLNEHGCHYVIVAVRGEHTVYHQIVK